MKVLLGVTGSVAAKLTTKMVKAFQAKGDEINVVLTDSAKHFVPLDYDCPTWRDLDEFPLKYERVNDDGTMMIPHIYLKDWADILVIAPLTANTLAKIANGIADNLLSCTVRAWNVAKPIVVAPAMNTDMWNHPVTHRNIESIMHMYNFHNTSGPYLGYSLRREPSAFTLGTVPSINMMSTQKRLFVMVNPVEKRLACGQTGIGAMADISKIVEVVNDISKMK
jgi:phosphopantothenoylcysteine decarboxylase